MHNAFSQSFAHRAPPASRTRGRWQPYAALASNSSSSSSSSSTRSSPANYLCTPTTSVTSASPQKTPACDVDVSRPAALVAALSKDSISRDGNKSKFALTLVDQSVKTLCDVWRPQDIPAVFNGPKQTLGTADALAAKLQLQRLASVSSTSPILSSSSFVKPQPSVPTTPVLLQTGTTDVPCPLVPIRGFVHEVLRRSRTSGGVLQTALCYLEAIRPKLHALVRQEALGIGMRGEMAPSSTITPATEAELALEAELVKAEEDIAIPCLQPGYDALDTVRIVDEEMSQQDWPSTQFMSSESSNITSDSSNLPSPLLCPRRTFIAALILASKFTQDKCYSNRAWAKLSGLPPREIGRCERALGNALEWRLWVGKAPAPAVPTGAQSNPHKGITRGRSEPSLPTSPLPTPSEPVPVSSSGLRRASTMPADGFVSPPQGSETSGSAVWYTHLADNSSSRSSSPLSDVPGLSYSPSSTESSSSSGERTIQMSTFLEDTMAPPTSESTQTWSWTEQDFMADNATSSPVAKINGKLLTGSGLSSFQSKASSLWQSTGFVPDVSIVDPSQDHFSGRREYP